MADTQPTHRDVYRDLAAADDLLGRLAKALDSYAEHGQKEWFADCCERIAVDARKFLEGGP